MRNRPRQRRLFLRTPKTDDAACAVCAPGGAGRSRGFSLIELMVVIAVAMVLTGLLMPAIRHVHENANRLICMSNLQQLGSGFLIYANDYNDFLPYSQALHENAPQNLMGARRPTSQGNWDGFGVLYSHNYCGAHQCFYCPSHHGNHPEERYADKWDESMVIDPIFTNYHYAGDTEWDQWNNAQCKKRRMSAGHALVLVTDGLRTAPDFNHVTGLNVLRADGSVKWRDDNQQILKLLPKSEVEPVETDYQGLWDDVVCDY